MHFQFDRAFKIFIETFPFTLLRAAVYLLSFGFGFLWFAGVFLLFQNWPFPGPSWLAWVFGGILFAKGARLVRNYLIYIVKAAHIGVITQLVIHRELPSGTTLIDYGWEVVRREFLRISLLFAVDRLVNLVLKAFNRTILRVLPFNAGGKNGFVQSFLNYSVGYVDEAIFSYSLLRREANPWATAREGLVLYAQNWRTILGSGLILAALSYVVVAVVAVPAALILSTVSLPFPQMWWALALGIGVLVKFIVMDPFALTCVIVNYHAAIAGQAPDPTWEGKLTEASDKFGEIKDLEQSWSPA